MKEFNLEAAITGAKVQLRDGRSARIISFNKKNDNYSIVALVDDGLGSEHIATYTKGGKYFSSNKDDPRDLVMTSIEKSGWINIYPEDEANAALIAAAPKLYNKLAELLDDHHLMTKGSIVHTEITELLSEARGK